MPKDDENLRAEFVAERDSTNPVAAPCDDGDTLYNFKDSEGFRCSEMETE